MTEIKSQTIAKWQEEWNEARNGRWTRRLIQDIGKWIRRRHGCISFHLTQMLTGHGCFGAYLFRFKRRQSPVCVDCGAEEDDAEHTVFRCDRWWRPRRELEDMLGGQMEPDNIIGQMLETREKWRAVKQFVGKVLGTKEEEERTQQRMVADNTLS